MHRAASRGGPLADRIHDSRTACKKIRAALQLADLRNSKRSRREGAYFGNAARSLGTFREADVQHTTIRHLLRDQPKTAKKHRWVRAPWILGNDAGFARRKPRRCKISPSEFRSMIAAERRFSHWRIPGSGFAVIEDDARHAYRRGRRWFHRAYERPSDKAFHKFRQAVKVLGYHAKMLEGAWPPVMKGFRQGWKELSEVLGEEHDITVLVQRRVGAARAVEEDAVRVVVTLADEQKSRLRTQARRSAELLFEEKPRRWVRHLRHWWAAAETGETESKVGRRKTGSAKDNVV